MTGYINGSKSYWYNRGYVEGNNKLPMSDFVKNTDYSAGYEAAIQDLPTFGNLGKIPTYTQKDFYLGIDQGIKHTDEQIDKSGIGQWSLCSPGGEHTVQYCAGFNFGADWEGYIRGGD